MQKIRNFIILLILLILQGKTISQPTLEWEARYSSGEAYAMALDRFGNVYVTGPGGTGSTYDYVTIKYNTTGQQQWVQTYNGPNNLQDVANALAVDDSGNVYVTGGSYNGRINDIDDWDYVTIKYNTNGIQQWIRTYSTLPNFYDVASAIAIDENANVYVTGYYGMRTIKYDRNGTQLWSVIYNVIAEKRAYDIEYKNGFVYVTGYSNTNSNGYENYVTIKYNSTDGSEQWVRLYNGTGNSADEACCIAVDDSANVFVGGSSYGIGTSGYDYVTIKYNTLGNILWEKRYDSSGSSQTMNGMVIDNLSNVLVTGQSYQTLKYSSSGVRLWVNNYYVPYSSSANSIAVDRHNNVYVTGRVQYPPPIRNDIVTIKYNDFGIQQWLIQYNSHFSNRDDRGNVILVDTLNNVFVAGGSGGITVAYDFITIKYNQVTGIQNLNELVKDFELFQNYPNPFNSNTIIEFSIPLVSFVRLTVFDVLGIEVKSLVSQELKQGKYRISFNPADLSSGIYFYKLITEKKSISKKLIFIK